jgi:hypothetical protein
MNESPKKQFLVAKQTFLDEFISLFFVDYQEIYWFIQTQLQSSVEVDLKWVQEWMGVFKCHIF